MTPQSKARALIDREIEAGRITPGHHQLEAMASTIAALEAAQRADDARRADLTPEVAIERAVGAARVRRAA